MVEILEVHKTVAVVVEELVLLVEMVLELVEMVEME